MPLPPVVAVVCHRAIGMPEQSCGSHSRKSAYPAHSQNCPYFSVSETDVLWTATSEPANLLKNPFTECVSLLRSVHRHELLNGSERKKLLNIPENRADRVRLYTFEPEPESMNAMCRNSSGTARPKCQSNTSASVMESASTAPTPQSFEGPLPDST
jgi:hypothetical protein